MKKIKHPFLIFGFTLLSTLNILAQEEIVTVPPSPNAAHLGTYGEMSVSKATGSADISVPVLTLQEGGITVPINLSYQSAGLRVDERPSWVGMGWILSAGGVITRTIRGRGDDLQKGFLENLTAIPNKSIVETDLGLPGHNNIVYDRLESMLLSDIDYTPDAFSFNFAGQGGSFFFGNDDNIHIVDHSSLKFEPIYGTDQTITNDPNIIIGWHVIDEAGLIYEFRDYETTELVTDDYRPEDYISAWYLTSIYNPITNTKASFAYDDSYYQYYYPQTTTQVTYQKAGNDISYGNGGSSSSNTQHITHKNVKFISEISINDQTLTFSNGPSSDGFRQLNSIRWNNAETTLRNYSFNYGSFQASCSNVADADCNRLKINSFTDNSKTYNFDYYEGNIPKKRTGTHDAWGYYAKNSSTVPKYVHEGNEYGKIALPNFDNTRIGMLSTITYPTGGSTSFFYEQNTWEGVTTRDDVVVVSPKITYDITGEGDHNIPVCVVDDSPYLDSPTAEYKFVYQCRLVSPASDITNRIPTFTITDLSVSHNQEVATHTIEETTDHYFIAEPGHAYLFELCTFDNLRVKVDMTLETSDLSKIGDPIARLTGGLRLGRIENWDPIANNVQIKTFDYGYGGYKVWRDPTFHKLYSGENEGESTLVIISSPTGDLGPSALPVAYQTVSEWFGTKTSNNGRIETIFKYAEDYSSALLPQESNHSIRTKIDVQNYYDQEGTLIKSEDFDYVTKNVGNAMGFVARKNTTSSIRNYETDFTVANFWLTAKWHQLLSKTTIDHIGVKGVTNKISYEYGSDLHTNPTRETVFNSKGEKVSTEYTYAIDQTTYENNCYETYHQELSEISLLVEKHAIEAGTCRTKWTSCYTTWRSCYADSEPRCFPRNNVTCYSRDRKICNEEFDSCLTKPDGYNVCLDGLTEADAYQYEKRLKAAFVNLKICQGNLYNTLLNEYEEALLVPDNNKAAVARLNLNNMRSTPVEIKLLNTDSELSNTSYQYNLWNDKPLLDSKSISYAGNPSQLLVTVQEYDSRGNPLEVLDHKSGFITTYIWGYNETQLIAKVVNATRMQVLAAMSTEEGWLNDIDRTEVEIQTAIDEIRNHANMTNAQITTYTYKPSKVISTITDPNNQITTYEYDEFDRLKLVRDYEGNIVEQYNYKYINEQD